MRKAPEPGSSTKTVSEKPSSAATRWRALWHRVSVQEDPERVAAATIFADEDLQDAQYGRRGHGC